MIVGECNCGAVRYQVDAEATGVHVCHCFICRRFTGTNGNAVVVVNNDKFAWIDGESHISTWKKPGMIGIYGSVASVGRKCRARTWHPPTTVLRETVCNISGRSRLLLFGLNAADA